MEENIDERESVVEYMSTLDNHLRWYIQDFVKKSPRQQYNEFVQCLKQCFKYHCSYNKCKMRYMILDGEFVQIPFLYRTTNAHTCRCGASVSESNHRYCYACAEKGSEEFNYHHRYCDGFTPVEVVDEIP